MALSKFFVFFVLALPPSVFAVESSRFAPIALVGFDAGGENLAQITNDPNFDLKSGNGLVLGLGASFDLTQSTPHTFEVQLMANYKLTSASNEGTVSWHQGFFELMHFYRNRFQQFRIGYGLTQHIFTDLEGDNQRALATTEVNKPMGFVVSTEFYVPSGGTFGVRYRNTTFEGSNNQTAKAISFGVYAILDMGYMRGL